MLSPADAELVGRESDLRGLATLLDPVAFLRELRAALPELSIESARPTYTRYKPHTNCLIGYQLRLDGRPVLVYAKTYRSGAEEKLGRQRSRAKVSGALGSSQIVLGEHSLVTFAFPNDAKLDVLSRIEDPRALEGMLMKVVPDRSDLWGASVQLLRYKPERRFVGRLTSPSGSEAALRLYTPPEFKSASYASKKLESRDALLLAPRLGSWKRKHVMAIEWMQGSPLRSHIRAPSASSEPFYRVGGALAALHAQRAGSLLHLTATRETDRVREALRSARFLRPDLGMRLETLADDIAGALASRSSDTCALHGDFYDDQVLLSGDQIVLLDLDRAMKGSPAADLGNFLAHMQRDAAAGVISDPRASEAAEALIDGYQNSSGAVPSGVPAYAAAALARLCAEPFRERLVDWPQRLEELVEAAELTLRSDTKSTRAASSRSEPVSIVDSFGAAKDEFAGVAASLDPAQMQPLLDRTLAGRLPANTRGRLRSIRVLRHKLGRRCLVEYGVDILEADGKTHRMGVLGKIRARGLDKGTYRVVEALWSSNWSDRSDDCLSVPEPLGAIPELHMWLQRKVGGKSSTPLLEGSDGSRLAVRIAELLHKLHLSNVPPHRESHLIADEMRILHDAIENVAAGRPEWRDRLSRLIAACDRLASGIETSPLVHLHRDFYPDQVVVGGHRLFLVDLDLYCAGDAALDAGNFTAHLIEQSLRRFGDASGLADRVEAFRERFLQLSGAQRSHSFLAYETLSLVRHIFISTRIPERQAGAEEILELCERRLEVGRPIPSWKASSYSR